jgi:hypothetical protein
MSSSGQGADYGGPHKLTEPIAYFRVRRWRKDGSNDPTDACCGHGSCNLNQTGYGMDAEQDVYSMRFQLNLSQESIFR